MKNIIKFIVILCCASSTLLSGCIDETLPTQVATDNQLAASDKATEALLWAMPAYTNKFDCLGRGDALLHFDFGYGSIMHIRDVMTQEFLSVAHNYDQYTRWAGNQAMGEDYAYAQFVWTFYWKFIQTTNNMIAVIDAETATDVQLGYLGAGYAFRSLAYLDAAQMFEFLENDKTSSTNVAGNNVLNLTVPIVDETITEQEARNNPRATREAMKEFILSDLNKAEQYIQKLTRPNKTLPDLAAVYGLKARLYMWIGEYGNAKTYARKAIDASNSTPLSKDQWHDTTTGFNDLSTSSWMWGSKMQKEDDVVQSGIVNWTAWAANEAKYGYVGAGPFIVIDKSFYDKISNEDFRKLSYIAPEGHPLDGKSIFIDPTWAKDNMPVLASTKFRPNAANTDDPLIGSASAYPMMRVEEMYFIEAEAAAHSNVAEGIQLINNFMQTYRYRNYNCTATTPEDVVDEIFFQKRVEFWGEGISYFDYKRLDKPVIRGYADSNHPATRRFNTSRRPAWMNFCIVANEKNNNAALLGFENPDPSQLYSAWTGK